MNYKLSFCLVVGILFSLPLKNRSLLLHDSSLPEPPKLPLPSGDPVKTVVSRHFKMTSIQNSSYRIDENSNHFITELLQLHIQLGPITYYLLA